MMKYLQQLGKSLMLPVATLPVASILMGIGHWIEQRGGDGLAPLAAFLNTAGGAIINNLALLFAVGVALGMAKSSDGSAALSGLVAFLVVTSLLSTESVAALTGKALESVNPAFDKIDNAFIGIISGIVAAKCFDKFSGVKLPTALSFFNGKRSVPIVTSFSMLVVSGILFVAWPPVYDALVALGKGIMDLGAVGAGLYGFFNRLLIPTGLHHALNSVFWFDVAGIDDIANFWASQGEKGITGRYMAGFFPAMMFGLPAAALAMYHTADEKKKKVTASLMIAAAFSAFFTGITEPLEFAFMFLAPGLYVVHAVLFGLSMAVAAAFQWTAGFTFSGGLIDFVLSSSIPIANKPYMLIVEGLVLAVIYYVVFRFCITKFNLKTPGREDDTEEESAGSAAGNNDFTQMAKTIFEGLGGRENIVTLDNCITRLRMEVKDSSAIDEAKIKSTGISGIMKPSKTSVQVIVGMNVQFVADEMKKLV